MTVPSVACTNCGKPFTTDDLRGTSCRYCGTLLAHHARAQQQVAVVNAMMADRNGNGIPDAFEGVVANAQANAMNQVFGVNPYGPQVGGVVVTHNAGHLGQPMHMHAAHMHAANIQVAQVSRAMSKVVMTIVGVVVAMIVLSMAIGVAAFVMAR